jgi:hypothetical protein
MPDEAADVTFCVGHSFYNHNTEVEDLSRQIVEQHQQSLWLEKAFRKYVPGFENCRIAGIGSLPGIRDSRRIVGEYVLKDLDIAAATKFEDSFAKNPEVYDTHHPTSGYWGFRHHVHSKEPVPGAINYSEPCDCAMHPFCPPEEGSYSVYAHPAQYCEIPYRCTVPLKVDNLFVVGRCMSTSSTPWPCGASSPSPCPPDRPPASLPVSAWKEGQSQGTGRQACPPEDDRAGRAAGQGAGRLLGVPGRIRQGRRRQERVCASRGDMMGVRLPDGKITMRFGNPPKEPVKQEDWEPDAIM